MKTQTVKINDIRPNEKNPRFIKDDKFKKLVKSIKDFPEMMDIRPIVVNADMVILGGNMRHRAMMEAGLSEVKIIVADGLTKEQEDEFIIKDNVGFGDWDMDLLANDWNVEDLLNWGMDMPDYSADVTGECSGEDSPTAQDSIKVSFYSDDRGSVIERLEEIKLRINGFSFK